MCPIRSTGRSDNFEVPGYPGVVPGYRELRLAFHVVHNFRNQEMKKSWHSFLSSARPFRLSQDTGTRGSGETRSAAKDRPTFVLVHGLAGSTASWDEVGGNI